MNAPWLSVVIPTVGRDTLQRTLDSIIAQPEADGVELIVVADTFGGSTAQLSVARANVENSGLRWLEHDAGLHCVGQPQRTAGARAARGRYVWFSQDDNIAAAGSLAAIHSAITEQEDPKPLFFRWLAPWRQVIWFERVLAHGNIDADCLVFPRAIAQEVVWGLHYSGDFDAATQAFNLAGGNVDWCAPIVSIARPRPSDEWWKAA